MWCPIPPPPRPGTVCPCGGGVDMGWGGGIRGVEAPHMSLGTHMALALGQHPALSRGPTPFGEDRWTPRLPCAGRVPQRSPGGGGAS